MKTYTVFNASQINGLPESFYNLPEKKDVSHQQRIAELEDLFAKTKADIYTGTQASYNQSIDRIQMPPFESFSSAMDYYVTEAHEITHWTKHPKRLGRVLAVSVLVTKDMPRKNWLRNWDHASLAQFLVSNLFRRSNMRPMFNLG